MRRMHRHGERNVDEPDNRESHSVLTSTGRSKIDGVPGEYNDGTEWLRNGLRRHRAVSFVALVVGWTGVWISLWGAALGAVVGILIAVGATTVTAPLFGAIGSGQAVTVLSVVGGIIIGAVGGFIYVLTFIFTNPISLIGSLVGGVILSVALVVGVASFERTGLRLRGYRRLSRDEVRRIAPIVKDAADAMDLPALPRFAIEDTVVPNAWSHMRTVVVTTGLLSTLNDGELRAVLVHELQHWHSGDSVGLRFVWAASWPAVLLYNFGVYLSGHWPTSSGQKPPRGIAATLMAAFGWFIAWPSLVLIKFVITPLTAASQRRYEYEADAAALKLGLGNELSSALRKMSAFEGGRTGWEQAMTATHPPVELRIEALQPARPDDWEYQEDDLHGPSWAEIRRIIRRPRLPKTIPVTRAVFPISQEDASP